MTGAMTAMIVNVDETKNEMERRKGKDSFGHSFKSEKALRMVRMCFMAVFLAVC